MNRWLLRLATAVVLPWACSIGIARAQQAATGTPASTHSGVWYEIFVRAWYDTDGDGTGDLNGVTAKLDYLKSLGVDGIWLMPINPSPSYHGYDVTDYRAINPAYGTLADFQHLLDEAHKRDLKVIIDLVVNHTSDRHPWFAAARDPADPHHTWYTWAGPHADLHAVSATGGPAWHALGGQRYLGTFTGAMPDLDYDTEAVRAAVTDVGRYWLGKGVDGFRLDAAQHVYFDFASQADDPAVLRKNLAWWRSFLDAMKNIDPSVYIVGEVSRQDPRDLAPWFGPLSAVFDFPLATGLIDAARSERSPALQALLGRIAATLPAGEDAPFLSNHDQERVMSQLRGDERHMRVAAAMLLTLPGRPFLYYGEELGTRGRKPDPDLREPMRWHRDPQGPGESRWKRFTAGDSGEVSVDAERQNDQSLLAWYRTLIGWRRALPMLRDGVMKVPSTGTPRLAVWELADAHGHALVVHNLSGRRQSLALDGTLDRYTRVRVSTLPDTRVDQGRVELPAYGSAVLQ